MTLRGIVGAGHALVAVGKDVDVVAVEGDVACPLPQQGSEAQSQRPCRAVLGSFVKMTAYETSEANVA